MPERAIRFSVGDGISRRAATWRCWTNAGGGKSDVYLTCRELKGALKASAHDTGEWHIAFTEQFLADHTDSSSPEWQTRFVDKWPRPEPFAPGITLAFRIITPSGVVNLPTQSEELPDLTWIAPPPEGQAVETAIFLVAPTTQITSWPERSMGTELVGSFVTLAGDSVCTVSRTVVLPELNLGAARCRYFAGHDEQSLVEPVLRAIVFADDPAGCRVLVECIVEKA